MTGAADDFDALFDEVSAQRTETVAAPAPAVKPAPAPAAERPPAAPAPAPVAEAPPEDQSDKPIFERLGGIVRQLHDSLRELGYDRGLSDVVTQIGDAQGRLEYIASLTEQAAVKVLNAIDIGMPEQDVLAKTAKNLDARWTLLYEGKLGIDDFKLLAADSKKFSATVIESSDAEKARLLEIMMAQDFQDITGQLIKKVVALTHTVERELAQLLRDNAPAEFKAEMEQQPVELMAGPSVPTQALEQDDVDDLLGSLGF